ncbi:hypothetical protein UlMin_043756 [Ulmus minor]
MYVLQVGICRALALDRPSPSPITGFSSSFCGGNRWLVNGSSAASGRRNLRSGGGALRVVAMSDDSSSPSLFKMNLNEYMVTLEKPLGIRFGLSVEGKIFVHGLKRGGNAEKSRIVMVGDTLKKASDSSGGNFTVIKDVPDIEKLLREKTGSFSLVLERPFSPFQVQKYVLFNDMDNSFNRGRVPMVTWNKNVLAWSFQVSSETSGHSGFAMFAPKFIKSQGWKLLNDQSGDIQPQIQNMVTSPMSHLICTFFEDESGGGEWGYGSFPMEEYIKALDRAKGELYYNHALGMSCNKITDQIHVGSCIQTEADVATLSKAGVTAVLNFQSAIEAENWGVDAKSVNESCQKFDILMITYPIRDGDSFDLRKKLPFCVGLLLRLLKKNHRIFVTCTTGFDRSAACVIAYLHWMTDTSLHAAYNYVIGLHPSKPDRPAIAWATWDLIAMVEKGGHDGPATHAVTFVWNGQEGEDVNLVGDFTDNWGEPIKAIYKGGSRYEVKIRLTHGKYYYKYIVNGQWRHSSASPSERDESGNVNNVIMIGDVASVRPTAEQQKKDINIVKVIERPLTEPERFNLAKAARCVAFSICPITLAPK